MSAKLNRWLEWENSKMDLLDFEAQSLYFEDELTMKYQIQEMLRIEKIFESEGINEELDAYNPLIPDGHNWKATFMLEFDDPAERALRRGRA